MFSFSDDKGFNEGDDDGTTEEEPEPEPGDITSEK